MTTYHRFTAPQQAYVLKHFPLQGAVAVGQAIGVEAGKVQAFAQRLGIGRINQTGGTATLDNIRARCVIAPPGIDDDEGPCWLWQGAVKNGYPIVRHTRKMRYARGVVFELATGKPARPGYVLRNACGNPRCVNPDHMAEQSRARFVGENLRKTPKALHAARVAIAGRARSHLTEASIHDIRTSGDRTDVLSARHGISESYVRRIRNHQNWVSFGGMLGMGGVRP